MIRLKQAVIVEGRYDKIKLSGIIDALIIETDGFGIFKDKELQRLIRMLAEKDGITEKLKAEDQMLWVQRMNAARETAMEIVNHDLIYM